jgi:hypothetical protein
MAVRVITVEREYGSGGGEIAARVASEMGWELWDQLLTDEIARRLHCDRRAVQEFEEWQDPAFHGLMNAFMRGSFEGSVNAPRFRMVDTGRVFELVSKLLPEIAEGGNCVIVGRGSAYVLGSRCDAMHVFVYAPFRERVRRLQATGKSEAEANELAQTVDGDRAEFIRRYFNIEWPGRHRFHLMVNSGMGDEVAVGVILDAAARYGKRPRG